MSRLRASTAIEDNAPSLANASDPLACKALPSRHSMRGTCQPAPACFIASTRKPTGVAGNAT